MNTPIATTHAATSDERALQPLPEPDFSLDGGTEPCYYASSMRAYGLACIATNSGAQASTQALGCTQAQPKGAITGYAGYMAQNSGAMAQYGTPATQSADAKDAVRVDDLCALLPGPYYMDLPDGGDVTVLEQLRRMSVDAARYRWLMKNYARIIDEPAIDAAMQSAAPAAPATGDQP